MTLFCPHCHVFAVFLKDALELRDHLYSVHDYNMIKANDKVNEIWLHQAFKEYGEGL